MAVPALPAPGGAVSAVLGSAPALAVPVDRRPASFDDALAQYRASRTRVETFARAATANRGFALAREADGDALLMDAMDLADRVISTPSRTLLDLAAKLAVLAEDGDWNLHAGIVVADARRLAGVA